MAKPKDTTRSMSSEELVASFRLMYPKLPTSILEQWARDRIHRRERSRINHARRAAKEREALAGAGPWQLFSVVGQPASDAAMPRSQGQRDNGSAVQIGD